MTLRVTDLSVRFDRDVLHRITAAFAPARVTAVLGPNGAGKTTLVRTLLGLERPTSGHVTLDDKPIEQWPRRDLARRVAHIPQRASVAFAFSVREVVALGRYQADKAADAAQIDAALHAADIADRAAASLAILSEGQRQRVLLARALAQLSLAGNAPIAGPPCYILADEPASAMDLRHTFATLGLFRALAARGVGVVVVLHDLPLVMQYADEVVLLDRAGRLAASGSVEEVMRPDLLERIFEVPFTRTPDGPTRGVLTPIPPLD